MVVEVTGLRRAHLAIRNLEVAASEELRHGPVVDAPELDHEARLAFAAPLHMVSAAVEQQARSGVEAILKICQGQHLDSSIKSKRTHHLPHSDHAVTSPVGRLPPPRGEYC